ncbi:MAG: DUF484 family protein [Paracoccaceae bacterium]
MNEHAFVLDDLKDKIIADPDMVLEDREVMRALIAANESSLGDNIVDLRGIALDRLESRLDRLEDTHRSVIAAAYENLAGTNQVHRAILRMLDPIDFAAFLKDLPTDVAEILRVDSVRLVLETLQDDEDQTLQQLDGVLSIAKPGSVDAYITQGNNVPSRAVTLRQIRPESDAIYGDNSDWIRSEACLKLDFGPGRLPGMLALGSEDPHQFRPTQGTDLLAFFAGVFERSMRRWLG